MKIMLFFLFDLMTMYIECTFVLYPLKEYMLGFPLIKRIQFVHFQIAKICIILSIQNVFVVVLMFVIVQNRYSVLQFTHTHTHTHTHTRANL